MAARIQVSDCLQCAQPTPIINLEDKFSGLGFKLLRCKFDHVIRLIFECGCGKIGSTPEKLSLFCKVHTDEKIMQ